jgi:hypothetical protein
MCVCVCACDSKCPFENSFERKKKERGRRYWSRKEAFMSAISFIAAHNRAREKEKEKKE